VFAQDITGVTGRQQETSLRPGKNWARKELGQERAGPEKSWAGY